MNVLLFLIPLSLTMAVIGLIAFIWSTRSGQFSDLRTPGERLIFDDADTRRKVHPENYPKSYPQSDIDTSAPTANEQQPQRKLS